MQSRLKKNAEGYGYQYTDLAQINALLEANGLTYYQFLVTEDGADYVFTVRINEDGSEEKPIRGARVVLGALSGNKSNPAQDYGSALTYARRYSLLMAYGLATTDDDAASLTVEPDHKQEPITDLELATLETMTKKAFPNTEIGKIFPTWPKLTKEQYAKAMQTIKERMSGSESKNN